MAAPPLDVVIFVLIVLVVTGVTYPFRRRVNRDAQIAIMFAVIWGMPTVWVVYEFVVEPPQLAVQRFCLLVVLLGMAFLTIAAIHAAHRAIWPRAPDSDTVAGSDESGVSIHACAGAPAATVARNNDQGPTAGGDELQELLQPLQQLSEDEFYELDPLAHDPEAMAPWDLLAFRRDGTPMWWPTSRDDQNEGDWTPQERRRILLEKMLESLPPEFPQSPSTPQELRTLLQALRHVAFGVTSGASGILTP
jgi:hypothetical protein